MVLRRQGGCEQIGAIEGKVFGAFAERLQIDPVVDIQRRFEEAVDIVIRHGQLSIHLSDFRFAGSNVSGLGRLLRGGTFRGCCAHCGCRKSLLLPSEPLGLADSRIVCAHGSALTLLLPLLRESLLML
ncbi:hypothetical protein AW168_39910 [Nocardia brasiliensis]|uniref:Uncharacterized protein n=1 Tax=Nocardia brasiliensis (strain ATCC 700358 / HUJEG-1) TaxID=1133849 RepID=K0ES75_NOCB7|nr:hypothetical protein O3I_023540 [Nocardia brasiliensis ATCC 700358]OCF84784.1 hypothetical protein AW168_39910 [Nocardia brasiliensis]